jgi:ABC-type transport system involved in cytochrome bd biosynthesis fused ATPase/permease subunit
MRGRTTILITHRLTPLSACDAVLTLERGQLVRARPDGALARKVSSARTA